MSASMIEEKKREREIKCWRCKFRNASFLVGMASECIDVAAVEPPICRREGEKDTRRQTECQAARAGSEIDGLAEASGAVLAPPREEAAEEHGDDVFWVVAAGDG